MSKIIVTVIFIALYIINIKLTKNEEATKRR